MQIIIFSKKGLKLTKSTFRLASFNSEGFLSAASHIWGVWVVEERKYHTGHILYKLSHRINAGRPLNNV